MKNRVITAFVTIFAVTLIASFGIAQAETSNGGDDNSSVASAPAVTTVSVTTSNGGDDGVSITSSTGSASTVSNGNDDGASNGGSNGSNTTMSTVSNGSDDGVSNGSNNGSNGSSGTITNGDDDAAGSSNPGGPSNPGNPGNPGGPGTVITSGTSSGGGSTGGSNGGTSGSGVPNAPQVLGAEVTSCPLIKTFMKLGWNNNGADVAKLQAFLKQYEGLDVSVTGVFDAKTDAAVRAFQKKYLVDVMGPWDATRPSGIVYITTSKKINELACKYPLTLSAAEIAIINAYKHNQNGDAMSTSTIGSSNDNASSTATVQVIGQDDASQNDNIAAVGGSSIFSRFWAFVVSLFQ